jgi:hypothetical protein
MRLATDFRSYPSLPDVATLPPKGLDYALSLDGHDRRSWDFNPIENLAPLAKAGAKIMHLHGDKDTLVPTGANSTELYRNPLEIRSFPWPLSLISWRPSGDWANLTSQGRLSDDPRRVPEVGAIS